MRKTIMKFRLPPLQSDLGSRTSDFAGYVLFDVLMAIFLFGLGFAVLTGLTQSYMREVRQAANLTEAANIAEKCLESLTVHKWEENFRQGRCWPGSTVQGVEGRFNWQTRSEWDVYPDILRVTVEVQWLEGQKQNNYLLESAYYVEH